jgi:catechol 2,3-dioxygenase-like lactoylglutathione lyase family enzyme
MRIGWDSFMKIESIKLFTSELAETFQFYEETLECPVRMINEETFVVEIGETHLYFQQSDEDVQPFYHFAIDIPYNHFYDMKQHYQNILFLLMEDGAHATYFESFIAHSFYFHDPSGNVVELIARISNITDEPEFSRISEIGFVCNEANEVFEALSKYYLNTYENQPFIAEDLNFIGDTRDDSFILLTPENNKWLFSEKMSESYPITIQTSEFELSMDQQDQWHLITL